MAQAVTARAYRVALVVPTKDGPTTAAGANVAQVAMVNVVQERAITSSINQVAIVSVSKEYHIPVILLPIPVGKFMATMPYIVGEFKD